MASGNILIIEDEDRLRANVKILLDQEGDTVTTAMKPIFVKNR